MRIALLATVLLLSGCGFQLRGANELPPNMANIYLEASGDLREQVQIFLQGGDAKLVPDRESADVVLSIVNPRYGRRVLSVDPNTGKEREIELSYTADVTATRAGGASIISPQPVTLLRDYIYDQDTALGSSREETTIRIEMVRDLVQQVMFRLRAAATA